MLYAGFSQLCVMVVTFRCLPCHLVQGGWGWKCDSGGCSGRRCVLAEELQQGPPFLLASLGGGRQQVCIFTGAGNYREVRLGLAGGISSPVLKCLLTTCSEESTVLGSLRYQEMGGVTNSQEMSHDQLEMCYQRIDSYQGKMWF